MQHLESQASEEGKDIRDIVPFFKLEEGVATSTFALSCAAGAGVDAAVLRRARAIAEANQCLQRISYRPAGIPGDEDHFYLSGGSRKTRIRYARALL